MAEVRIGTAAWSIPAAHRDRFPPGDSILARYAGRLDAVEINSSFYRPHRPATYRRWAGSVPADFRFAVKMPKQITHERRLADSAAELAPFLDQIAELGDRLGPVLVQLPPSLRYDRGIAETFFADLRRRFTGDVACEPRHPSWFDAGAAALLIAHRIARVAADPAVVPTAAEPGGWQGFSYWRLHGSPRLYYSDYPESTLSGLAGALDAATAPAWCIFDNTALGHATANAIDLASRRCRNRNDPPCADRTEEWRP